MHNRALEVTLMATKPGYLVYFESPSVNKVGDSLKVDKNENKKNAVKSHKFCALHCNSQVIFHNESGR